MNSNTVWSGENISTADLRPSTSSTVCTSLVATQASPPRDQSICRKARASAFAAAKVPSAIGSSSTVCQTTSTLPSASALFLLGASSMKTISMPSPSSAAAEPGWVVRPPLPTTSAMWPGHCESATLIGRRPGIGATVGSAADAGAAGTAAAGAGGAAPAGGTAGRRRGRVRGWPGSAGGPPRQPVAARIRRSGGRSDQDHRHITFEAVVSFAIPVPSRITNILRSRCCFGTYVVR